MQIKELQRAVRDCRVYLCDEREVVVRLQTENEQLKLRDIENRRRIQHLLALTQPVTHETTFFRPGSPAKTGTAAAEPPRGPAAGKSVKPGGLMDGDASDCAPGEGGAVDWESRAVQAEAHLERLSAMSQERAETWRREREAAEEEARARDEAGRAQVEALAEELRQLRAKGRATAEQLVRLRQRAQVEQSAAKEQLVAVRAAAARTRAEHEAGRAALEAQLAATRAAAEAETDALRLAAAGALEGREADASGMRDEFEAVKRLYSRKLLAAEHGAEELRGRLRRLQTRRARDLEGFGTDVCRLRRALAQLETQWALVGETAYAVGRHGLAEPGPPLGVAQAVAEGEAMHQAIAAAVGEAYPRRPPLTAADRPWRAGGMRPPPARGGGGSTSFRPSQALDRAQGGRAAAASGLVPGRTTVQAAAAASGMRLPRRGREPAGTTRSAASAARTPRQAWQVGGSPLSSPLPDSETAGALGWSGVISQDGDRDSPLEPDGKASEPAVAAGAKAAASTRRGTVDPPALPPATDATEALGRRWEAGDIRASLADIAHRTGRLQRRVGHLARA